MAESTAKTYLGYGSSETSFTKACDIIDYPDLTSPAERIEVTTLSDIARTYIKGISGQAEQTFTANYEEADYEEIEKFGDTEQYWAVVFASDTSSDDSASGTGFVFKAQSEISVAGAGVGDVKKMIITLYPLTKPKMKKDVSITL
jgi:hypothetical protein